MSSCELLSEFSTFGISNNENWVIGLRSLVVNCFQNLVPLVSATTYTRHQSAINLL